MKKMMKEMKGILKEIRIEMREMLIGTMIEMLIEIQTEMLIGMLTEMLIEITKMKEELEMKDRKDKQIQNNKKEKIRITQEAIENNANMATEIMKNIEITERIEIIEIIGIIIEEDKEETIIGDIIIPSSTQIAKM